MGATIYFRNSKIVVPVSELAETLHQLSIAEATLSAYARNTSASPDLFSNSELSAHPPARTERALALEFLKLIQDFSRSGGAPQTEVMRVLGASHPKGIGSKAAVVNRALTEAGFVIDSVYSNDRDPSGARSWKARDDLERAIKLLSLPIEPPHDPKDNEEDEL